LARVFKKVSSLFRDEKKALLVLLGFALVLRLLLVSILDPHKYYFSDTRHYDKAARSLIAGDGFGEKYSRAPLYALVMAAVYGIFGASFLAMRLVEAVAGTLLCLLIYRLARLNSPLHVAQLALILAAVFPHFLVLVGLLYPTNIFTLFLALAVYFILMEWRVHKKRHLVFSGVFAGLAALTVPSIFFVVPFWVLWFFLFDPRHIKRNMLRALAFLFPFVVTLLPWTIRNYQLYGRLTLVQPLPHTVLPNLENEQAQQKEVDSGFRSTVEYRQQHPLGSSKDTILNTVIHYAANPLGTARHVLSELRHFWALYPDRLDTRDPAYRDKIHRYDDRMFAGGDSLWLVVKTASILIMLPLFVFALVGLLRAKPFSPYTSLLFLTIFGMSIGYSLIYAEVRYRIPVEPFVLIFAAVGLQSVFSLFKKKMASPHAIDA
jgi:4-amino-4-deoxy-L-arabinose transferase-like glycosyltransferase